jgi:hypothetical protein
MVSERTWSIWYMSSMADFVLALLFISPSFNQYVYGTDRII